MRLFSCRYIVTVTAFCGRYQGLLVPFYLLD